MSNEAAKQNFWKWFTDHQEELETFIQAEDRDYRIYDSLTAELKKFNDLLFPEITINPEGKYVLIITPDGLMDGIEPTREIVAVAPAYDKWVIVRFRQPMDDPMLNYNGLEYPPEDIRILHELDEKEGKVHVEIYIKNMNKDEKNHQALAFLYMDHILGEFNTITKVGYIDFIHLDPNRPVDGSINLLELRKLIEDKLY